jgi:hypothetical protein
VNFKDTIDAELKKLNQSEYKLFSENDITEMFENVGRDLNEVDLNSQLQHLNNYTIFNLLAEELRKVQSATNWSTNTQNSYFSAQEKLQELDSVINEETSVFTNLDRIANESIVSNFRVQDYISNILGELFDITTEKYFTKIALTFGSLLKSDARQKFYRTFSNDFFKFVIDSKGTNVFLAGELFIDKRFTPAGKFTDEYEGELLKKFFALKKEPKYKNNAFIQQAFENTEGTIRNIEVKSLSKEVDSSEAITEGITQMLDYDPELGMDIVILGLIQDGLNKSPISWSHYISYESYMKFIISPHHWIRLE